MDNNWITFEISGLEVSEFIYASANPIDPPFITRLNTFHVWIFNSAIKVLFIFPILTKGSYIRIFNDKYKKDKIYIKINDLKLKRKKLIHLIHWWI